MYVPLPYVIALACFGFSAGALFGACLVSWAFERHAKRVTYFIGEKHLPAYRRVDERV